VESLGANAEQAPEIPAPDADPALGFEQVRLWEALQKQLDRLPARAAKAFVLSELEGRDADEVSRILGITPNNVWGMVRRARKSLQESMAPVLSAAI